MSCVNQYEQISDRTKKIMIFCKLKGTDGLFSQLCVGQRYCGVKGRYIETNQKMNCKEYKEK